MGRDASLDSLLVLVAVAVPAGFVTGGAWLLGLKAKANRAAGLAGLAAMIVILGAAGRVISELAVVLFLASSAFFTVGGALVYRRGSSV